MRIFLDSSAFAKRFVEEPGSGVVEEMCAGAAAFCVSVICVPEIVSGLNRRVREQIMTRSQYTRAKQRLSQDIRDAEIVHLSPAVIATSIRLLEQSPLRAMDALHIACAIECGAELFASSDRRQLQAADRAGLKTQHV